MPDLRIYRGCHSAQEHANIIKNHVACGLMRPSGGTRTTAPKPSDYMVQAEGAADASGKSGAEEVFRDIVEYTTNPLIASQYCRTGGDMIISATVDLKYVGGKGTGSESSAFLWGETPLGGVTELSTKDESKLPPMVDPRVRKGSFDGGFEDGF